MQDAIRAGVESFPEGNVVMKTIRVSLLIPADVEMVFRVLSDIEHIDTVIPEIKSVELMTKGPVDVGTRFRETRQMQNKKPHTEELTVTELNHEQHVMAVECESMGAVFKARMSVIRMQDHHCEATTEMTISPTNIIASGIWVVLGGMTRRMMAKARADADDISGMAACGGSEVGVI